MCVHKRQRWARGDSFMNLGWTEGDPSRPGDRQGSASGSCGDLHDVVYSPTTPRGCRIPEGPWPMADWPQSPGTVSDHAFSLLGPFLRLSVTACGGTGSNGNHTDV